MGVPGIRLRSIGLVAKIPLFTEPPPWPFSSNFYYISSGVPEAGSSLDFFLLLNLYLLIFTLNIIMVYVYDMCV